MISLIKFGFSKLSNEFKYDALERFCEKLKNKEYNKIAVLLGNGVSINAGIPNLKSPEIQEEIKQLDIPFPEVLYDLNFFKIDPYPFYKIFNKLNPSYAKPTNSHYLVKILEEKSLLLLVFTKNNDSLEKKAGINENKIIFAHGNAETFHCAVCNKQHDTDKCLEFVNNQMPPFCECGGPIKPNILFLGEKLKHRYYYGSEMLAYADLMIIIGCSLSIFPFSSLPTVVIVI